MNLPLRRRRGRSCAHLPPDDDGPHIPCPVGSCRPRTTARQVSCPHRSELDSDGEIIILAACNYLCTQPSAISTAVNLFHIQRHFLYPYPSPSPQSLLPWGEGSTVLVSVELQWAREKRDFLYDGGLRRSNTAGYLLAHLHFQGLRCSIGSSLRLLPSTPPPLRGSK